MANSYFMGGTSAKGFQTKFSDIINKPGYFTYILKGGPGTGKSTLMKKVLKHFSDSDNDLYYCSSDISSLDAVVIHDQKAIVVDGTSPHIFNPVYPGISQTLVDLGSCWDRSKLINKEREILRCFKENAAYHRRAKCYVTALTGINDSIYDQASAALNLDELSRIAEELSSFLPDNSSPGSCNYQQLSAITSAGYFTERPSANVFALNDPYYAAGSIILGMLKNLLVKKGQDIVISECHMFSNPLTEHIYIPQRKLLISHVNPLNKLDYEISLDCTSFYSILNTEELCRSQDFALSLEKETAYSIGYALDIHDDLESYYIDALNFDSLNLLTEELIESISAQAV